MHQPQEQREHCSFNSKDWFLLLKEIHVIFFLHALNTCYLTIYDIFTIVLNFVKLCSAKPYSPMRVLKNKQKGRD